MNICSPKDGKNDSKKANSLYVLQHLECVLLEDYISLFALDSTVASQNVWLGSPENPL